MVPPSQTPYTAEDPLFLYLVLYLGGYVYLCFGRVSDRVHSRLPLCHPSLFTGLGEEGGCFVGTGRREDSSRNPILLEPFHLTHRGVCNRCSSGGSGVIRDRRKGWKTLVHWTVRRSVYG